MKYCFIINPASGKEQTKVGLENKISECAERRNIRPCIMITQKPGDTVEYIKSFAEQNPTEKIYFYVCGGDGTLCEAVNGIMALKNRERIYLGIIPVGTGNDFVRNFGDKQYFLDIDAQLDASSFSSDLLRCNEFYCANMINIGFDCQVVVKTAKLKRRKWLPSKLAYICGLVITLIKKPGVKMQVITNKTHSEIKELLLTTFANGSFCGGGFHSNPEASLCDGMINSLFVNNISRTKFISIVGKYKSGTHLSGKYSDMLSTEKMPRYTLLFDEPTAVSVDGEIVTLTKAEISCIPGALNVLVPAGCEYSKTFEKEQAAVL